MSVLLVLRAYQNMNIVTRQSGCGSKTTKTRQVVRNPRTPSSATSILASPLRADCGLQKTRPPSMQKPAALEWVHALMLLQSCLNRNLPKYRSTGGRKPLRTHSRMRGSTSSECFLPRLTQSIHKPHTFPSSNQVHAIGLINTVLTGLMGTGPHQVGMCSFYVRASFRNREGRLSHEE